jgi:hypothetical protein
LNPFVFTVELNVAACPKMDGLSDEATVVVVGPVLVLRSTLSVELLQVLLQL